MYHTAIRQRRTEPWPQVTCTENFMEFKCVVFEDLQRTDRQTDTLIAILHTLTRGKLITDGDLWFGRRADLCSVGWHAGYLGVGFQTVSIQT